MKAIIIGCGRVGSSLAAHLGIERHAVCVIDRDPASRALLPADFPGRFLVGNGYNRTLLEAAGVAEAEAFVAVTSGDNTNIVGARIAKEHYRVPRVAARIYEPHRADIYRDLGIPTVTSVRWIVTRLEQMLLHRDLSPSAVFGNGETLLVRETVPSWMHGHLLREFEIDGQIRVVAVTRSGHAFVPRRDAPAQAGDELSFAVTASTSALGRLRSFLGKELGT